jgi:hypothetical protein
MNARFTIDGSEQLEARLNRICGSVADRVLEIIGKRPVEAILLGGGYGRGEGGVLRTASGDEPYNDLEFYILLKSSDLLATRRFGPGIHHAAEQLSADAGIEIELKLLPLPKLCRAPVSMFYYDLISGHRAVYGTDEWLRACEHHRAAHRIPLYEGTRLLMNRCSGLLFAQERLARPEFKPEDADFVGRNLAKAKLALGDVALTMRNQYHWSVLERHKRLRKLSADAGNENLTPLLLLHEQGVQFKLHPLRTDKPKNAFLAELDFLKQLAKDLWLKIESRRLDLFFPSIESYALDPSSKCPETNCSRNRLINARTFGVGGLLNTRYPRERLLRALPLLLWADINEHLPFLQAQLRTEGAAFSALVSAYERLWRIYN